MNPDKIIQIKLFKSIYIFLGISSIWWEISEKYNQNKFIIYIKYWADVELEKLANVGNRNGEGFVSTLVLLRF